MVIEDCISFHDMNKTRTLEFLNVSLLYPVSLWRLPLLSVPGRRECGVDKDGPRAEDIQRPEGQTSKLVPSSGGPCLPEAERHVWQRCRQHAGQGERNTKEIMKRKKKLMTIPPTRSPPPHPFVPWLNYWFLTIFSFPGTKPMRILIRYSRTHEFCG